MKIFDKIRQSRPISFAVILAIYIVAAAVGILTYRALPYEWWLNLLIADIAATVITFIFSVIFSNASVYDPYWSVQPIVILVSFAVNTELTLARALMLIAVFLWGIRLTANWAYTFHGLCHQDWRYTQLCEQTGIFYPLVNLFGIHLVPTLIVYLCTVPAVYIFIYDSAATLGSVVCFILSVCATVLQGIADIQMQRFRKQKIGGFMRGGLWKYSRHPNYLGEILMWWGVALSAISAFPSEKYLCVGAAANTLLFLAVSIPLADKRQSKKPGFEEYKQATRMLLCIKK